jgi:hypothetical protein
MFLRESRTTCQIHLFSTLSPKKTVILGPFILKTTVFLGQMEYIKKVFTSQLKIHCSLVVCPIQSFWFASSGNCVQCFTVQSITYTVHTHRHACTDRMVSKTDHAAQSHTVTHSTL